VRRLALAVGAALALAVAVVALLQLLAGPRRAAEGPALPPELSWVTELPETVKVTVLAPTGEPLEPGSRAPREYTCDGAGREPRVTWTRVGEAKAYALIVYDPDAPLGTFYHLVAYDLAGAGTPAKYLPGSSGVAGWYPICPPRGHGVHRYVFLVVTYSEPIGGARDLHQLLDLLRGRAVAWGWTYIVYSR
jgi:phosphatidylethanolamine-binding protein (PEBP) family uncharacterized protein